MNALLLVVAILVANWLGMSMAENESLNRVWFLFCFKTPPINSPF